MSADKIHDEKGARGGKVSLDGAGVPGPSPALLLLGHLVDEVGVRLPVVVVVVVAREDARRGCGHGRRRCGRAGLPHGLVGGALTGTRSGDEGAGRMTGRRAPLSCIY